MEDFSGKIKQAFLRADVLVQFIYINVGVFILVIALTLIFKLFNIDAGSFLVFLEMPSALPQFIRQPWTLLTYMFLHYDLLHILINMLWLYWFGRIFLTLFNGRQLGGLYVLGGIGGGLLYLIAFNVFPYFTNFPTTNYMLGASASVLAIVIAPAIAAPNYPLRLFIFGNIKLKYIAIVTVLLDIYFLSATPENAGGHLAHLGGALTGTLFAWQLAKGRDITRWINKCMDWFWNLFEKKPQMKVKYNQAKNRYKKYAKESAQTTEVKSETNSSSASNELDRILDKLKKSGYESLSSEEKKNLFNASNK